MAIPELEEIVRIPRAGKIHLGYAWLKFNHEEKAFTVSPIMEEVMVGWR